MVGKIQGNSHIPADFGFITVVAGIFGWGWKQEDQGTCVVVLRSLATHLCWKHVLGGDHPILQASHWHLPASQRRREGPCHGDQWSFWSSCFENCHTKWENIFKLKDTHGKGAKIPNQGDEALPFKAKWTKDRCGQVRFGGWKDAYPRFEALKLLIVQMRAADEANGKAGQEYAKRIMRDHHKITAAVYTKKGRKQKAAAPPPTKKQRKLTRLDE